MLGWMIVALGITAGMPVSTVAVLAAGAIDLRLGIAVAVGAYAIGRLQRPGREDVAREARFLDTLADEVVAGSTLRQAVARWRGSPVDDRVRRLCDAGAPLSVVGRAVGAEMDINGDAFAAVCSISERVGAPPKAPLRELADRAEHAVALDRDRRVSVAQTRLSAMLVGVAPIAVTVVLVALRGLPTDSVVGAGAVVVGVLLQVIGVAVVFRMSRRVS